MQEEAPTAESPSPATSTNPSPTANTANSHPPNRRNKKKRWERDQVLSDIESNRARAREKEKLPRQLFLRNLTHALSVRVLQFVCFYLAVSLLLYAQDDSSGSGSDSGNGGSDSKVAALKEIHPLHILTFSLAVFAISATTTCLDYSFFYTLEVSWTGHYDVVYYAYSLHGVLGHVLSLVITINLLSPMAVIQKIGSLHTFTTSCLVVSLCYSVKEFYLRRHHKNLLKVRLKQKLAQMEEWSQILSKLGVSHTTTDEDDEYDDVEYDEENRVSALLGVERDIHGTMSNVTFNPVLQGAGLYQRNTVVGRSDGSPLLFNSTKDAMSLKQYRDDALGEYNTHSKSRDSVDGGGTAAKCCRNVCCGCGVESSCFSCFNSSVSNNGAPPLGTDDTENASEFEELKHEEKIQQNFWRQVNELKHGYLRVSSGSGIVTIRSRKQAEAYGNKLYMHLTNGNKRLCTGSTICEILRRHLSDEMISEMLPHVCHPLTPDRFSNTSMDRGGLLDIECHALRLFRCSEVPEVNDGPVSQGAVVNAVVNVFKEILFSRASLQDLNNLHDAAKSVVDFIFWVFMLLVVQVILRVDVSHVIAPLLTVLFGLSFAFSPVLSNLFLSMAFVMFLLPFNVGNRVIIGKNEKIKGNVFEMSLMNTTILTRHNEKLRIPNHVLFQEHITNLSEGMVSTFEIPLVFALDGPLVCSQEKIHKFINRIKKFAKEDNKSEWIDVIVFCDELNYGVNQVQYTFWCTHRASYQEVIRCYNGHTRMLEEMRRVQVELDIHLQKGLKLL